MNQTIKVILLGLSIILFYFLGYAIGRYDVCTDNNGFYLGNGKCILNLSNSDFCLNSNNEIQYSNFKLPREVLR